VTVTAPTGTGAAVFEEACKKYTEALNDYTKNVSRPKHENLQALLPVLLRRDEVAILLRREQLPFDKIQVKDLLEKDRELHDIMRHPSWHAVVAKPSAELQEWRRSLQPPLEHWWWWLEPQLVVTSLVGTVTILLPLIIVFASDIIHRIWGAGVESFSVVITFLTIILTSTAIYEVGRGVLSSVTQALPFHTSRGRLVASIVMLLIVVALWWIDSQGLAIAAEHYNAAANDDIRQGKLTSAQQNYQHAVALDPNLTVPYYNLAEVYQSTGFLDRAITLYQQAIEHDSGFAMAYRALGHVYNVHGAPVRAEQTLLAGLTLPGMEPPPGIATSNDQTLARYYLLADLGWAYFAQQQFKLAQEALEASTQEEPELLQLPECKLTRHNPNLECRIALPHYYLAQVYERMGKGYFDKAQAEWVTSLRLLDQGSWLDRQQWMVAWLHVKR